MASSRASGDELPDLAAPLRLSWRMVGSGDPIAVGPVLFASTVSSEGRSALVCIDDDGRERWRVSGCVDQIFVQGAKVITVLDEPTEKALVCLDLATGVELSRQGCDFSMAAILEDGSGFIGTNVLDTRPSVVELGRVDLVPTLQVKWRIRAEPGMGRGQFSFAVRVASGRVVVGRESGLEVLDAETGQVLWALDSGSPGLHRWNPVATRNHVVLDTTRGTEVLELETGRVCWATKLSGRRRIGDGRLVMLADDGRLLEFDLVTGAVSRDFDLHASVREGWTIEPIFVTDIAVSQTSVYVGDTEGRLWAFDRSNGNAVWSHKPTDIGGYGPTVPVILGGALYTSGGSWTAADDPCLYCYRHSL